MKHWFSGNLYPLSIQIPTKRSGPQLDISDYDTFIKLYIKFDILGAPDPAKRLKNKKAKTTARRKTKKTDTKKEE